MKILITGALGHIGSELIRKLPSSLDISKLILIDNFSTQRFCSLFNIKNKKNLILIEDDIRKLNLEKILEEVDIVIHLAAITDAAKSFSISEEVEENNLPLTAAEQMREYVEKVSPSMGDNGAYTKSPVASKNDMGGDAGNIAQGGEEKGMTPAKPKEDAMGNVNVPGAKASKSMKAMPKGHGAEKKGAGDTAPDKKSTIGS